jgi:hypothetical protein
MVGNNQHLLNVSPEEFEEEARKVLRLPTGADKMSASTEKREFRSSFGVTFEVCSDAWRRLEPKRRISKFAEPKHLLWAFVFLAVNGSEPVNCRLVGTGDRKSFRYWSWLFVEKISNLESEVVSAKVGATCFLGIYMLTLLLDCLGEQVQGLGWWKSLPCDYRWY